MQQTKENETDKGEENKNNKKKKIKIKLFDDFLTTQNFAFSLVYRASRDGDSSEEFHKRCDNIGPNITLIKSDKNIKFGGFTIKDWKPLEDSEEKEDPYSFCFSLGNNKKIYLHKTDKRKAIFCSNSYGPTFLKNIFTVEDGMLNKVCKSGKIEESFFDGMQKDFEITGGDEEFKIKELEVFELVIV